MIEGRCRGDVEPGGDEGLPQRERRLLAQWLREWRCEQALGERLDDLGASDAVPGHGWGESPERASAPPASGRRGGGARRLPAVRQIHLLHPADTGPSARPLFVALIARPASFLFRIAPFGRFAAPAVPGELETGRPQAPLRVLCAWNARTVHADVFARAWRVGRLTADECRAAQVLDGHDDPSTRPAGYAHRTGPVLRHPADPRHVYLRQESAILDHVCREGAADADAYASAVVAWPSERIDRERSVLPERLAAEAAPAYGSRLACRVSGLDACLELDAPGSPDQPCRITVRAADGSVSDRLDGATLVGRRRLVRIENGCALVSGGDLVGGLRLYDAGGERLRVLAR